MRKWLLLAALLLCSRPLAAQILPVSPQSVTTTDSGTECSVAGTCANWQVPTSAPSMVIQATGTFSGTLTIKASLDCQSFFAIQAVKLGDGTSASTFTTTGQYALAGTGFSCLRVVGTTMNSGGVNLKLARGAASSTSLYNSSPTLSSLTITGSLFTGTTTGSLVFGRVPLSLSSQGVDSMGVLLGSGRPSTGSSVFDSYSILELISRSGMVDGNDQQTNEIDWTVPSSVNTGGATKQKIAAIETYLEGTTANDRGGEFRLDTKADGGALVNAIIVNNVQQVAVPVQLAVHLQGTISSDAALATPRVLVVTPGSSQLGYTAISNTNVATPATMNFFKTRAALTSTEPTTTVITGDSLGQLSAYGADGSNYQLSSQIRMQATGTVAAGFVPGKLNFSAADSGGVLRDPFSVTATDVSSVVTTSVGGVGTQADFRIYSNAAGVSGAYGFFRADNTNKGRVTYNGGAGSESTLNEFQVAGVLGVSTTGTNQGTLNIGESHGAQTWEHFARASVTCNSGGATCTATNVIPAGSLVLGVTSRVTTILAGAALTTFKLGDGTTTNAFANTAAIAANSTTDYTAHLATWHPTIYPTATSVVATANAGVFSSGVLEIIVHYISLTAPTS